MVLSTLLSLLLGCQAVVIKVGMIGFEKTQPDALSFSRSAGMIPYAIDNLNKNGKLNNITFQFFTKIIECDFYNSAAAMGAYLEFIENDEIDVLIPGPCIRFIKMAGAVSTFYKIPFLAYGYAFQPELSDVVRYPFAATIVPNVNSLAFAFVAVIKNFEWFNFSLIAVSDSDYCNGIMTSIENSAGAAGISVPGVVRIDPSNRNESAGRIKVAAQRSRVFAFCASDSADKRAFLLAANAAGMNTSEYVFIMLEMRAMGYGQFEALDPTRLLGSGRSPFWLDIRTNNADGMDDTAAEMAKLVFSLDTIREANQQLNRSELRDEVFNMVRGAPINCNSALCMNNTVGDQQIAHFAYYLHDAFYSYGLALSKTIDASGNWNPNALMNNMATNFSGFSGNVVIDQSGNRQANYQLISLNLSFLSEVRMKIFLYGNTTDVQRAYTDESVIWVTRNGHRPLNVPICGYLGDSCPLTTWEQYSVVIIACSVTGFLVIGALICSLIFIVMQQRSEREREDEKWKISFYSLTKQVVKEKTDKSQRSLLSNPSTITSKTTNSSNTNATVKHSFTVMFRAEEPLIVRKINITSRELVEHREQITALRKIEHDNLNTFVGLVIDVAPQYALWRMCERGTLREVISHNTGRIDGFFMVSMISDIVGGLWFLHKTLIPFHGQMTSRHCFVTDSWQVKISEFGLLFAGSGEKRDKFEKLYHSPEILRGDSPSRASDVYALSMVMSEILTLRLPYAIDDNIDKMEEVLYFVKKGGMKQKRPDVSVSAEIDINTALIHLMRDCWDEEPGSRPTMDVVRNVLKTMQKGKQQNLMDYAMMQMEQYAAKLEMKVGEQSREIVEEKKRSDVLLYRMLPKTVADKLKLGQSVEPESFDGVTIFFSDIVKFTQLANKCTPYQIVNLLNELFTTFDNLIDKHGVYKVETIGDGYLCVSGLPYRNGDLHIRDIAEMSLDFMSACDAFRIPHLPSERVQLRVGMNSGPCVAGVVGLTMPRYCLFGDVVNTGSRMESNSKPGKIHMTESAHRLLVQFGGYNTESRGDVIIKGKGVMETFWLLSRSNGERNNNYSANASTAVVSNRPPIIDSIHVDEGIEILSRQSSNRSITPETENMYEMYKTKGFLT